MRGGQLARRSGIIRAIKASPKGLTVAEIAQREETGIRTIYHDLEPYQATGVPLYSKRVQKAKRWAFVDTFKSKSLSFLSGLKSKKSFYYRPSFEERYIDASYF